jgi:hypothetical protein
MTTPRSTSTSPRTGHRPRPRSRDLPGARRRHRLLTVAAAVVGVACVAAGCASPGSTGSSPRLDAGAVVVPLGDGDARIDPATLRIEHEGAGGLDGWSAPSLTDLGTPTVPVVSPTSATWSYGSSDLTVVASEQEGRLSMVLTTGAEEVVAWPVTAGPDVRSVEFPNGEGLSVPVTDAFWTSEEAGLAGSTWDFAGGLTMPFWGATLDGRGVSYVVVDDIGTSLAFRTQDGHLEAHAEHVFSPGRATGAYEVLFSPTDGDPVAAARDYRRYLRSGGDFVSLDDEIAAAPATEQLLGALHAYTWGDGRDPEIVARLQELGIEHAWLGYDADGDPMSAAAVAAAEEAGYLVGPYDTWDNAQDPRHADTEASVWPGTLWPDGCVLDEDGEPVVGFGGRGCALSTAALDAAETEHGALTDRVGRVTANGATSYFLDVDAVGQLMRDHSPLHPQTEAEDRARRLARLQALGAGDFSDGRPLVLGSETVAAWAAPAVSYSHGSSTPLADGLWALQQDADAWGGWWPAARPAFFFQDTALPPELATAMFDPAYRIPLYETVLHDSVISTDRWELGLYKFPDLVRDRVLTNVLYGTPAVVALDQQVLDEHGEDLASMQQFFEVLAQAAGTSPMTSFERVSDGVQRTEFGDGSLTVTVNFGTSDEAGVAGGCAVAATADATTTYCPPSP